MTGVLLLAHGTPESLDEIPEYLRLVRGGRPPSEALIEEIRHNYAAAGRSPLTEITMAQARALERDLGGHVPVLVGMRNWHPFIREALAAAADRGITRLIGIPMAPQFSTLSVQKYIDATRSALPPGVAFECVPSFHEHPLLLDAFTERLTAALPLRANEEVIFTAHSLPERVIREGDPYALEVAATVAGVSRRAGLAAWFTAYQSAGRTPEPWLGPDLSVLIRERAAAGATGVLVAPIGFVCDHTEILYDIDIQAARTAQACGLTLRRTESLNTSPTFIKALAALVNDA
jgi:ferrochelatase